MQTISVMPTMGTIAPRRASRITVARRPVAPVADRVWRARLRRTVVQAMCMFGALQLYRFVRTLTEGDRDVALGNGRSLLRFERGLGLDIERGIQHFVLGSRDLVDLFNRIYVWAFWPVVTGTLVVLFVARRPLYRQYRNALVLSGMIGLAVFGAFPVAPPRMLDGYVDTVHRFTDATSVARPGDFTNEFAAMPSFHVGWMALAGAAAMPLVPWRSLRPLLLTPALVMTVTVMATANHYLIDAVVGVAITLSSLLVVRRAPAVVAARRSRVTNHTRRPARATIPRRRRAALAALGS